MAPDDKMAAFIRRHHVMTLATVGAEGTPWCAHAFYAYVAGGGGEATGSEVADGGADGGFFVFSTAEGTRHGAEMAENQHVAAAIALETRTVGRLQGLQIEGTAAVPEGAELAAARRAYLRRFPYAAAMPDLALWTLHPTQMKLTDNTLGFGKKLVWKRDA